MKKQGVSIDDSQRVKVTLSLRQEINRLAEKVRHELHLSKSEVFVKAIDLLAQELEKKKSQKENEK